MSTRNPTVKAAPAKRVRREAGAARDHILQAAEALLAEQGPLALKLTEIAAAARVANATVLHHFGSIDALHAALMERMIDQLVADILASTDPNDDAIGPPEAAIQALFDVFERRGAARLAAWLELTGEVRRLTHVRDAIRRVVTKRVARGGPAKPVIEDMVLASVLLAMGAGLFGRSLAELMGKPPGRARKLATAMLRGLTPIKQGA